MTVAPDFVAASELAATTGGATNKDGKRSIFAVSIIGGLAVKNRVAPMKEKLIAI